MVPRRGQATRHDVRHRGGATRARRLRHEDRQVRRHDAIQSNELSLGSRDAGAAPGNLYALVKLMPVSTSMRFETTGVVPDGGVRVRTHDAPVKLGAWHHIELIIDFANDTTALSVDGSDVPADDIAFDITADFIDAKVGLETDDGESARITVDDYFVDLDR